MKPWLMRAMIIAAITLVMIIALAVGGVVALVLADWLYPVPE